MFNNRAKKLNEFKDKCEVIICGMNEELVENALNEPEYIGSVRVEYTNKGYYLQQLTDDGWEDYTAILAIRAGETEVNIRYLDEAHQKLVYMYRGMKLMRAVYE